MSAVRNILFILDGFELRSPGQQLLDRFLIGYNREGAFQRLVRTNVILSIADDKTSSLLQSRANDYGLKIEPDRTKALSQTDALVIVPRRPAQPDSGLIESCLSGMPRGTRCFVYGAVASDGTSARNLAALAADRSIALTSATALAGAFRLPGIDLPRNAALERAAIVVQGPHPDAELDALEGLFPFLQQRRGGETGVRHAQLIQGAQVWTMAYSPEWTPTLSCAMSRSNTIQGDPELDGRTQDVFGSRRLPRLPKNPRMWILEHEDPLRTALFVLDGALADINGAFQLKNGTVLSTQLYRPPAPMQDHFSRLARAVDDFFQTGKAPWQPNKPQLVAAALELLKPPTP